MMLWVGHLVERDILTDLFGVSSPDQINPSIVIFNYLFLILKRTLPTLPNIFSERVNSIVLQMQGERARYCQLQVVRQKLDSTFETEFASLLIEDKHMDGGNYVDYLCAVHR